VWKSVKRGQYILKSKSIARVFNKNSGSHQIEITFQDVYANYKDTKNDREGCKKIYNINVDNIKRFFFRTGSIDGGETKNFKNIIEGFQDIHTRDILASEISTEEKRRKKNKRVDVYKKLFKDGDKKLQKLVLKGIVGGTYNDAYRYLFNMFINKSPYSGIFEYNGDKFFNVTGWQQLYNYATKKDFEDLDSKYEVSKELLAIHYNVEMYKLYKIYLKKEI
jgi:hypothetical protein